MIDHAAKAARPIAGAFPSAGLVRRITDQQLLDDLAGLVAEFFPETRSYRLTGQGARGQVSAERRGCALAGDRSPARDRMGVRKERSPTLTAKIASFLVTGESLSVASTVSVSTGRSLENCSRNCSPSFRSLSDGSASVIQVGRSLLVPGWNRPPESATSVPGPASVPWSHPEPD